MSYSLGGASGSEPHHEMAAIARASEQIRTIEPEQFNTLFRQIFELHEIEGAEGSAQELGSDRVREILCRGQEQQGSEESLEGFPTLALNHAQEVMRNEARRRFSEGIERWVRSAPEEIIARQRVADSLLSGIDHLNWPKNITEIRSEEPISTLPDEIGLLSNLRILNLAESHCLRDLPDSIGNLRELTELNLSDCISLHALPDSIGNLRKLTELNLWDCVALQNLPESIGNLEALRELLLNGCISLEALPESIGNLQALITLFISNCSLLRALPGSIGNLQALTGLFLNDCTSLENLPDSIGRLQALRELNLNGCGLVDFLPESIGGLRSLVRLSLTGCSYLRFLPESIDNLEALTELNLEGCTSLDAAPAVRNPACSLQLPRHLRRLISIDSASMVPQVAPIADDVFIVRRTELRSNPIHILKRLVQTLRDVSHHWLNVKFQNERGVDAGGLRKSLWTEIGRNLFSDDLQTTTHLYALRDPPNPDLPQKNGWIPGVRNGYPEDVKNIEDLGVMMSWGASRGNPPLLFPSVLDPRLFAALKARVSQESEIKALSLLNEGALWRLLFKNPEELEDGDWALVQENLEGLGYETASLTVGDAPAISDELSVHRRSAFTQLTLVAVDLNRSTLEALDALARGMEIGDPLVGEMLRAPAVSAREITKHFLGSIDPETLVASVSCHEQGRLAALQSPSQQEQQRLEQLNRYLGWLKAWLRDPVSDQEKQGLAEVAVQSLQDTRRRAFLNQVTGKEAVLEGEEIFFLGLQPQELPSLHTCYNRLDFPMHNDYTEANFRDDLTALVAVQDQGYNSA